MQYKSLRVDKWRKWRLNESTTLFRCFALREFSYKRNKMICNENSNDFTF